MPDQPAAHSPADLPRRLGFWSAIAVIIGIIIGSGIFKTPASIAQAVDSVWAIMGLWVAGGLVTLCLGLCMAELATLFPHSGGLYVYLREAYGPTVAFVFGWTFLLINPSVWSAIAIIFAQYLGQFVPLSASGQRGAATVLILFVTVTNYFSVRLAVSIQNIATAAKTFALVAVAGIVFGMSDGAGGAFTQPSTVHWPALSALTTAFLAVLFSYEGVAGSCSVFGEVRDPARTLPRALIISVVTVTLLYLLVNAAYLYVLPLQTVATSELVAAQAMAAAIGPAAAAIIAACVMLSTFGAISATAIVDPRVFYAMARDGLFFQSIGTPHPRFQTPHVAVAISGVLACCYVWMRSFEQLAAHFVLGLWPFYLLAVAGLMLLRWRRPDALRPFRTPLYPLVPLVFIMTALGLLVISFIELPETSLINLGVAALGTPVYLVWRRYTTRPTTPPATDLSATDALRLHPAEMPAQQQQGE